MSNILKGNSKMMTAEQLTNYANKLCIKLFGVKYDSYVKYNNNLRACAGRFIDSVQTDMWGGHAKRLHKYHIDLNKKLMKAVPDELYRTLAHELCHYYCYVSNRGYHDWDDDFKNELAKHHIEASCYVTANPRYYVMYCPKCHRITTFKTHVKCDYACAYCHKRLVRYGFITLHGVYRLPNNPAECKIFPDLKKIVFSHSKNQCKQCC